MSDEEFSKSLENAISPLKKAKIDRKNAAEETELRKQQVEEGRKKIIANNAEKAKRFLAKHIMPIAEELVKQLGSGKVKSEPYREFGCGTCSSTVWIEFPENSTASLSIKFGVTDFDLSAHCHSNHRTFNNSLKSSVDSFDDETGVAWLRTNSIDLAKHYLEHTSD